MSSVPVRALLVIFVVLVAGCAPSSVPAPASGAAPAASKPAAAEGSYRVGVSAAITGPFGGTYSPAYEGFKVYLDRLNERGGIDGRRVELISTDDRGEPPRATANAKRLVEDEKVLALVTISPSATYAPMMTASRDGRVPLLFTGVAVCPPEVYPPQPERYFFCASFNLLNQDAEAIVQVIRELTAGGEVKLGLVASDIPISRQGVDLIEKGATQAGMQIVGKVAIPPGTADYGPFASRFIEAGANYVAHWAPFDVGTGMVTALSQRGWSGTYMAEGSPQAEDETARFKQPNFYLLSTYSFAVDGLPVFKEMDEAAKTYNATFGVGQLTVGWVGALALEAGLKTCGWPCDAEKLRSSLETVRVDTQGLYGGPIDWTPSNHVRSAVYYKLYRWDGSADRVASIKDWFKIDVR